MYPQQGGYSNNPFTGGMQMTPTQGGPAGYGNPNQGYGMSPQMPPQYGGNQGGYGYQAPMMQGNMAGMDPAFMNSQAIFNTLQGIYIKQKMSLTEVLTGFNTANKYQVFELSNSGNALRKQIFQCTETSDCCDRMCMAPECRGISLNVAKVAQNTDFEEEVVLRLVRECQCTCCCCNRPEMKVYYVERGNNMYLGKVVDPFDCCTHNYEVFDANNQKRFHVAADCCQLGFICNCPCDSCETIEFKLWSGDKQRQENSIVKKGAGCAKNAISTADNFAVPFPMGATWQDKALLLALALMIDFLQFEDHSSGSNNGNRRGGYHAFD